MEITKVEFLNEQGVDSGIFVSGEKVKMRVHLKANEDVDSVVVGILIRDRFGQDIFGTNTHHLQKIISMKAGEIMLYEYSFNLNIGTGKHTITLAVHKDDTHVNESYHWCDNILSFEVVGTKDYMFYGVSKLDVSLNIINQTSTVGLI